MKKIYYFLFQIISLIVGITALILQVASKSIFTDEFMINHSLAYFTIQTNIFAILLFLYLIVKEGIIYLKEKKFVIAKVSESLQLAITFYITITMLGYWLVLTPISGLPKNPLLLMASLFLHTFMPLLTIIYTAVFMEHGKVNYKDIIKWFCYPICYLISIIVLAHLFKTPYYYIVINDVRIGLTYPYPFVDPAVIGYSGMVIAIICLVILFYLLGTLYIYIDKKLGKQKRNRS